MRAPLTGTQLPLSPFNSLTGLWRCHTGEKDVAHIVLTHTSGNIMKCLTKKSLQYSWDSIPSLVLQNLLLPSERKQLWERGIR